MSTNTQHYKRQATAMERLFTRSPFSLVTMVARIRGNVTEDALGAAIAKARLRHVNLRVRIAEDAQHNPWLTSEGATSIPIEVVHRDSADQWIDVVRATSKVPFDFDTQIPVRFILLRSDEVSELVVMCHHMLCDGMSLAYLVRDLLQYLGDPTLTPEALPDPTPVALDTMPESVSTAGIVKYVIGRMNRKWEADPVYFSQHDYELLSQAYWQTYDHQMMSIELSENDTTKLVERCRREHVTVNSALATAFAAAQAMVLDDKQLDSHVGVAADLRSRLRRSPGEVMGFYAGVASHKYKHNEKLDFWDNARRFHKRLQQRLTDKTLFKNPLNWSYMSPSILDAINFKKLGNLVPSDVGGSAKLRSFSRRKDVVKDILRREKMESPDRVILGTAITNLTRLDFPTTYGSLELERMIMKPGGAFPLGNVNLVVGAATAAGRLSLAVEYVENNITNENMETIKKTALSYLFDED